jgi:hypothetical protein
MRKRTPPKGWSFLIQPCEPGEPALLSILAPDPQSCRTVRLKAEDEDEFMVWLALALNRPAT